MNKKKLRAQRKKKLHPPRPVCPNCGETVSKLTRFGACIRCVQEEDGDGIIIAQSVSTLMMVGNIRSGS